MYSSQTYTEIVREFMKDVKTLLCAYGVQADRSLYSTIECMVCNAITEATIITAHATDAT